MTDKKKKKKVNNLNLKECEAILQRLQGQNENRYYQDVLNQYRRLIPEHKYAIELNKIDSANAAMPIIEDK